MNKAYRLIWSKAKDAWVIVAEIVKGNGGPPPITVTAVVVAAALALAAGRADALPTGQQVVNGTATFVTSGSTLTVTNSPNSIINWQGFSIGAGERTTFNQQSTSSAVLNRVIGPTSSSIFGMLDSNGKVFLINPNGILFGAGSQVNVGGLVASSLGISNNDFINGTYSFSGGAASGPVSNAGTITTTGGGKVWLIAPNVTNTGIITAPNGDIVLAAGQQVYIVDPNNPEVAVVVNSPTDTATNIGSLLVTDGSVSIFGALVNQKGIISADHVSSDEKGRIFLKSTQGTTLYAGSSTIANADYSNIQIESTGGAIIQGGTVSTNRNLNFKADSMTLSGGSTTAQYVNLNRATAGAINLGAPSSGSTLGLTQSDLSSISAANALSVGDANASTMAVSPSLNSSIAFANAPNLALRATSIDNSAGTLATTGSISLAANGMTLAGGTINAPIVTLNRATTGAGTFIDLGIAASGATLGLTQSDLNTITTSNVLRVGDVYNVGTLLRISNPITRGGTLHLMSGGGGISQTAPLTVNNLAVESGGSINLNDSNNSVGTLAGKGGDITYTQKALTPLTIDAVDGLYGIYPSNSVTLKADNLTLNQQINSYGSVTLAPTTAGRSIDLLTTKTGTKLELTPTEISNIFASGGLTLSTTGDIAVSATTSVPTYISGLTLNSATITQTSGVTLSAPQLTLNADVMTLAGSLSTPGNVALGRNTSGVISILPGKATSGTLELTQAELGRITAGSLTIGNSLTTALSLSTTISTSNKISLVADSMSLSAGTITAPNVNLSRATSGSTTLGAVGGLSLLQADLNKITASTLLSINGGTGAMTISGTLDTTNAFTNTPNLSLTAGSINNSAGSLTTSGAITLAANSMTLAGGTINAPAVTLTRATSGAIDLGAGNPSFTPSLLLTQGDLDSVSYASPGGVLRIGDTNNTSSVSIYAPITRTAANNNILHLISNGIVYQNPTNPGGKLTVTNLAVEAGGNVSLDNAVNSISKVAATSTVGGISLSSAVPLTIDTVDGLTAGIQASSGNVYLKMDGLTIGSPGISAQSVSLAPLTANTPIDVGTITGGSLSITQAGLNRISTTNLTIGDNASGNLTVSAPTDWWPDGATLNLTTGGTFIQPASLSALNGTIAINAANINLSGGISSPTVSFSRPISGAITLDSTGVPTLGLTNTELGTVTASTLNIGDTLYTSGLNISSPFSLTSVSNLSLTTRSDATTTSSSAITAGGLALMHGSFNLSGPNQVNTIAGSSAYSGQTISFTNGKALTVGNVGNTNGFNGLFTNITLATTAGDLAINAPVSSSTAISLTSPGNLSVNGTVSTPSLTLRTGGTFSQTASISATTGLGLAGGTGTYTLDNSGNNFGSLSGSAGSVTVKNYNKSLTIGASGLTATIGDIDLTTTGLSLSYDAGIIVNGTLTAANIKLTGKGYDAYDGIVVNAPINASNAININGTGGNGYYDETWGVAGGNGVTINSGGVITAGGNVSITGIGGSAVNGGTFGGHGISMAGSIDTSAGSGSITLIGTGGAAGPYGDQNSPYLGSAGGNGITISNYGTLTTGSGAIALTGIGGAGGQCQGASCASGVGGAGGAGISMNVASISSISGGLTMNGTGGSGGNGLGGDGSWGGIGTGTGASGSTGVDGTGGDGGRGINITSGTTIGTYGGYGGFSSISMTGVGGAGGTGIGGFGGAGDGGGISVVAGGAGGLGGVGRGGAGGTGIYSEMYVYNSPLITLTGAGALGGNGLGGFGGSGGPGGPAGPGNNGGAAGAGNFGSGGSGGTGIDTRGTITASVSGSINLTGSGNNGGDSFGSNPGMGGSKGSGGTNGATALAGTSYGGTGGTGFNASSTFIADGGTINMVVSGGLGSLIGTLPGSNGLGITGEAPTFNAGTTGTVTITTPSVSQISLGAGTAGGTGIDSAVLSDITAGSVVIGDSVNTSAIVLDGAVNMKDATPLSLATSGTVADVAGTPFGITAPILTVNAGTGISLLGANLVPIANLNTISGNIAFNNTLTVAQASHLNTTGTTSLTSTGVLTVDGTSGTLTTNSVGLSFGATTINGDLNATSTGGVSQTGKLAVSGATSILAGTNTINLNDPTNALTGPVTITGGTTTIKDASALTAHLTTGTTDLTSGGILSIDGTTGNLTTSSAGLSFGPTTVTGNLGATSTGAVAQTGVLTVTGTTSIAAGSNSVALNNPGNDFAGVLTVAGGTTSIKDANTLVAHLNNGATDLTTVGTLTVDGTSGSLTTNSAGLTLGSGTMTASGALSATSTGNIIYQNTVSAADLSLNASGTITGTTGVLTASGKLSLIAGSGINLFGNATGQGGVALSSGTGLLDTSKGIVSNGGTSAPVSLIGDSFNLGTFSAGSAPLQITTFTKSQALNLGSGSSTLPLSAASLVFGDAGHTGAININGPLNLGGTASFLSSGGSLSLLGAITAPGAITIDTLGGGATTGSVTGTGSIKAASLTVNAGSGIDLGGSNAVTTLTLKNAGATGNINFKNSSGAGTNLTVGGSNSAAGGSFTVGEATGGMAIAGITTSNGAVSLSGAQDISFSTAINAGTGAVSLTTTGGAISGLPGASSIVAGSAQLTAMNGIGATTPFQTTVGKLGASNTNNAIQLKNSGVLTVTGITNGGLILLDNTGATTLAGAVKSNGSTVRVTAHSPLTTTIGADVSAYGDVTLFAGASGSIYDSLTINSLVDSQTGNVLLMAGESVFVNGVTVKASENLTGNSFLNALNGKVIIRDHLNSHLTVLTTQTAALLPGVYEALNENIAVMGREATDLTKEENSTGEGGQNGTEFKSLPYCN